MQKPFLALIVAQKFRLMIDYTAISWLTYIFAVFRFGKVDEVVIVHILSVEQVTVLPLAQVLRVNAVGPEELLIGNAERLADGLRDQLGLHGTQAEGRFA